MNTQAWKDLDWQLDSYTGGKRIDIVLPLSYAALDELMKEAFPNGT